MMKVKSIIDSNDEKSGLFYKHKVVPMQMRAGVLQIVYQK